MLDLFSLKGQVALFTGASRGLGKAMAIGLAKAGAHVAVVGRSLDQDVLDQITDPHNRRRQNLGITHTNLAAQGRPQNVGKI